MRALVYRGPGNVRVTEAREPEILHDDDIIIKVAACAICGSDLHIYHGMIPKMSAGSALGHEAVGVVVETGKGVRSLKKQDRVVVPFPVACGHCFYCEGGLWSQCDESNPYGETGGMLGYGRLFGDYGGAQAEYLRVPYANAGPVVLPEELGDEQALLLADALPTSCWAVETAGVKKDDTVAVLGCGPVGLLAVKWAALAGARRIIAADWVGYRLERAASFGAETVDIARHKNAGEHIKELTGGGADAVIDCAGMGARASTFEKIETFFKLQGGSKSAIEIAAQAVRKGGTVSIAGVYGARYNMFPLGDFFARNVSLRMGLCPAQGYIRKILPLIMNKEIDLSGIVTHRFRLDMGARAYEIFDKKKDGCIKVVLRP